MRKLVRLVALGRVARLGPLGLAMAAYTLWRQLSPEDQERVRRRASSVLKRVRSHAVEAPVEPRAWTAGEA